MIVLLQSVYSMNSQLQDYAERLSAFSEREVSVSVAGLASLARAYVALHNLTVTRVAGEAYGTAELHLSRIRHLYSVCEERFRREKNFASRCHLLNVLHVLGHEPFSSCTPWADGCDDLLDDFIAHELPLHRDCSRPGWLWCIARWAYPLDPCSKESEGFRSFRRQLAAWASQLDGKDHWPGLTAGETLSRLGLLNTNADTVASGIAMSLASKTAVDLVFCFEKDGVLADKDDDSSLIEKIDAAAFERLKAGKVVADGMLPKLENAFKAIANGVSQVVIKNSDNVGNSRQTTILWQ